jgi:hypothetical protein
MISRAKVLQMTIDRNTSSFASQTVRSIPPLTVPPEVCAFAHDKGVEQHLPALIDLSRRVFPEASRVQILLDEDPEIADDRHIVFRLAVPLDMPESLAADRQWIEGLNRVCPKAQVCVFRLSLDLVR